MIELAFTTRIPLAVMIAMGIKQWENRAAMPIPPMGRCAISCSKSSDVRGVHQLPRRPDHSFITRAVKDNSLDGFFVTPQPPNLQEVAAFSMVFAARRIEAVFRGLYRPLAAIPLSGFLYFPKPTPFVGRQSSHR